MALRSPPRPEWARGGHGLLSRSVLQVPVAEGEDTTPEIQARAFRVVCDSMLQGLARSLRCLGVDVLVLGTGEDHRRAAEVSRPGAQGPAVSLFGLVSIRNRAVSGVATEGRAPLSCQGHCRQGQRCLQLPGTWGLPAAALVAPLVSGPDTGRPWVVPVPHWPLAPGNTASIRPFPPPRSQEEMLVIWGAGCSPCRRLCSHPPQGGTSPGS